MALQTVNISDLKYHKEKLVNNKSKYDDKVKELYDLIKNSTVYWNDSNAEDFRYAIKTIIYKDLRLMSTEMSALISYLNKLIIVLENSQEQIKNKLNG